MAKSNSSGSGPTNITHDDKAGYLGHGAPDTSEKSLSKGKSRIVGSQTPFSGEAISADSKTGEAFGRGTV